MIKFSISLNGRGQSEEARLQIVEFLAEHGIKRTGGGFVTLSFVAEPEAFGAVFGSALQSLPDPPPRPRGTVGASGQFEEPEITVPEELEPFVDSVSVSPSARHFSGSV
ncbi:MAG: hypothetical protein AAGC81_17270 [Pseudomonadota bacterium]